MKYWKVKKKKKLLTDLYDMNPDPWRGDYLERHNILLDE